MKYGIGVDVGETCSMEVFATGTERCIGEFNNEDGETSSIYPMYIILLLTVSNIYVVIIDVNFVVAVTT